MRVVVLLGLGVLGAVAQPMVEPPPLVRLIRRPAGDIAAARRYADAGVALNVIGMSAVTGPAESWLLETHVAFAGIEAVDRAVRPLSPAPVQPADDLLMAAASWGAAYIPGLSYRLDQALRGNLDRPDLAYRVISGAPGGTYLFFAPLASLKVLGDALPGLPAYAEPAAKAGSKAVAEGGISREHLLFRVEPGLSYVSDDFASGDPEFWRVTQ